MRTENFVFNGYNATVIIPDNPNGRWIWKTEFLYAFDKAERELLSLGYTRVYYGVSDMYGSGKAIRLMHGFHKFVSEKYSLDKKAILFGFSRGALYAFNYALFYPEYVEKIYLDAPVLDLKSWPWDGSREQGEMFREYGLDKNTFVAFKGSPADNLCEFFEANIPLLLIAGDSDKVVDFYENSKKLIDFCEKNGIKIDCIVKPGCDHHPHSLDDVTPIIDFAER